MGAPSPAGAQPAQAAQPHRPQLLFEGLVLAQGLLDAGELLPLALGECRAVPCLHDAPPA
jgi:hypothetical protein